VTLENGSKLMLWQRGISYPDTAIEVFVDDIRMHRFYKIWALAALR